MMESALLLIGLINTPLFILGMVFFLIGVLRSRKAKYYERTTGVIVAGAKKRLKKLPFMSEKTVDTLYKKRIVSEPNPTVSYEVGGQTYTYRSSISQEPAIPIGKEVNVLYNPRNPEEALIDSFVQRGSIFTLVGCILFIIMLIALSISSYVLLF